MSETTEYVNISELARITGKDRATISKRVSDLPFKRGQKNEKLYDKTLALMAVRQTDGESDAKERKLVADAEKAELLVRRLKGELVPVADMKQAAAELIKTLYARTVRVMPSVISVKLISKENPLEIENIVRAEVAAIYDELKSLPENFLAVASDDEIEDDEEQDVADGD